MAKKKEIVVRISPDGSKVSIDQVGMVGKECDQNLDAIGKLGKVIEDRKKPEYYRRKEDVHIDVKN